MGFDFRNPFARDKTTTPSSTKTGDDTNTGGDTKDTNTEWTGTTYGMAASAATALLSASLCFAGANRYSIANSFSSNAPSFRNTVLSTAANNTVLLASTALLSTAAGIGLWLHSRPDTEDATTKKVTTQTVEPVANPPETGPRREETFQSGGRLADEEAPETRPESKKSLNNPMDKGGPAGRKLAEERRRVQRQQTKQTKQTEREEKKAWRDLETRQRKEAKARKKSKTTQTDESTQNSGTQTEQTTQTVSKKTARNHQRMFRKELERATRFADAASSYPTSRVECWPVVRSGVAKF